MKIEGIKSIRPPSLHETSGVFISVLLAILFSGCQIKESPLTFSAIGDVPYSDAFADSLRINLIKFNKHHNSSFLIHLGDIKSGSTPCEETKYQLVADILMLSEVPVFIIPGDNEYNDCEDPKEAFALWNKYFYHFHENWEVPWETSYQLEQLENFTWVKNDVLYVGLNLVGGHVHDSSEWDIRLEQSANWIGSLLEKDDTFKAMVVFGHANMNNAPEKFELFTDKFRALAANFKKPILYLHGDGHYWIKDRPWKEQNIQRVQVDAGARILHIKIDTKLEDPFVFVKSGEDELQKVEP